MIARDLPENYESNSLSSYYPIMEPKPRRIAGYGQNNLSIRLLDLDPIERTYPGDLFGRSEGNIYGLTPDGVVI